MFDRVGAQGEPDAGGGCAGQGSPRLLQGCRVLSAGDKSWQDPAASCASSAGGGDGEWIL